MISFCHTSFDHLSAVPSIVNSNSKLISCFLWTVPRPEHSLLVSCLKHTATVLTLLLSEAVKTCLPRDRSCGS